MNIFEWQQREGGGESRRPAGLPPLVWRVLQRRGVNSKSDLEELLSFRLSDLTDPLKLSGLERAIERLVTAYQNKEQILLYADFDMDGTPALALLLTGFKKLGFESVESFQPSRLQDGYGLHARILEKYREQGVSLVVTADVGITAVEAVASAKEKGLDVIITDHHLESETRPDAYAIVNPNQTSCESGMGHLCGTGVAFFLVMALRRSLRELGLLKQDFDPKELLDCYAVGTISDVVPLRMENRILVRHGLHQLQHTKRPGLRELMKTLGLSGRTLSAQDVAMRFAPKLNALSRMDSHLKPIDLFTVEDEKHAKRMASEVIEINKMRMALQATALQEAQVQLFEKDDIKVAFVYSSTFHKGVVGLVAVRIAEEFGVPAFVGSVNNDKGTITGSARIPNGSPVHLVESLQACSEALVQFGGHKAAAGFELRIEEAEAFENALVRFFTELGNPPSSLVPYDCNVELGEIDADYLNWMEKLEPFGHEFETATLKIESCEIRDIKVMKGGHVRLKIVDRSSEAEAVWFSPPEREWTPGERVSLLVEAQWNWFAGRKRIQLLVKAGKFIERG